MAVSGGAAPEVERERLEEPNWSPCHMNMLPIGMRRDSDTKHLYGVNVVPLPPSPVYGRVAQSLRGSQAAVQSSATYTQEEKHNQGALPEKLRRTIARQVSSRASVRRCLRANLAAPPFLTYVCTYIIYVYIYVHTYMYNIYIYIYMH